MIEPDLTARVAALEAGLAQTADLLAQLVAGCESAVLQVGPVLTALAARQLEIAAAVEALAAQTVADLSPITTH